MVAAWPGVRFTGPGQVRAGVGDGAGGGGGIVVIGGVGQDPVEGVGDGGGGVGGLAGVGDGDGVADGGAGGGGGRGGGLGDGQGRDQHGDGGGAGGGGAGGGQVLPGSVELRVLVMILSPVSGLLTVTVKVMVADWPGARSPVQVRSGLI